MPTLYLIRHGLAGQHGSYANDEERPLTDEGQRKTRKVAERLQALGVQVAVLQSSPLVRARQTADLLQAAGVGQTVEESRLLAPEGRLQDWVPWYAQWRESLPEGASTDLALVGHEPNLSTWAEQLVWGEIRHHLVMKKAGVIGLQVPDRPNPVGACELFWLTPPRFLL